MRTLDGGRSASRALAVAALALAGLAFSLTPVARRLDEALLDADWRILRRLDPVPAPDEISIVGIDEASLEAIPEPPALWHAPLAAALVRVAAARPRAIVLDFPLPERSYDGIRPGLDRALFDGLAAAAASAPFVAPLHIDPRSRSAREIHKPYLALLGESRLGLSLIARDADGVARRYALTVPTEDGGFPTLEGRLCRALKAGCNEGLIHFALGKPFAYVPIKNLLEMRDAELAGRLFRGRIVLIGEVQAFSGRVEAPVNPAGWEMDAPHTPGIVLRAQTLRTALAGAAPTEGSKPLGVLLVAAAALLVLVRDWRLAALTAGFTAAAGLVVGAGALRAGWFLPLAAPLATLAAAAVASAASSRNRRRR